MLLQLNLNTIENNNVESRFYKEYNLFYFFFAFSNLLFLITYN